MLLFSMAILEDKWGIKCWVSGFAWSVGLALLGAVVLKFQVLMGGDAILGWEDSVLGVSVRVSVCLAILLEVAVLGVLVGVRNLAYKLASITFVGLVFCGYHLVEWGLDVPAPCVCLGRADGLPAALAPYAKQIALGLSAYFGLGGGVLLKLIAKIEG